MTTAIELESLSKSYRQAAIVVNALSVQAGEVLGIFGANGAGKTTVLKMTAGLLAPDTGRVRLNGLDLADARDEALRQVTALVPGAVLLDEHRSLWENLLHGRPEQSTDVLRELGLWERRDALVDCLSQGLQRRAALASALVSNRAILLLDEPTLNLDDCGARAVEACIRRRVREQGMTAVIATCQQRLIRELCDRVAIMKDGSLIADTSVDRALSLSQRTYYRIRLKAGFGEDRGAWFGGLKVTVVQDETILSGPVTDQPALHGLLARIRDLGLPLISVDRFEPDLEDALG